MNVEKYLNELDDHYEDMCPLLKDWSEINSGTFHLEGINHLQEKIIELFLTLDSTFEKIPSEMIESVDDSGHIIARKVGDSLHFQKRPLAKYQLLLVGHCDTVFEKDHPFQRVTILDEQTWQGPGLSDMKGGLLVMYYALKALESSPYKENIGWQVFINADEEVGSLGSAKALAEIAKTAHFAFLYEPAMDERGTLAGQRKGTGNFTVMVHGKSAHVGRAFSEGKNAIIILSSMMQSLHALNKSSESIVNIGYVHGGGALNKVPDFALCKINVRTNSLEDEDYFLKTLERLAQTIRLEYGVKISVQGGFHRKPKLIDEKTQRLYEYVLHQGKYLGLSLSVEATGGCCDGNNLSALGIPNVDTLGVRGGLIHTSHEYIKVESLLERAKLSALLFMGISSGSADACY
jgi:glutamate carboxypeptidase